MSASIQSPGYPQPKQKAEIYRFADDGKIPNNPKLPLLIYRNVVSLTRSNRAAIVEDLFATNRWTNSWRNGIYPFHHYHSNTHEVLGVFQGKASVLFGGENGVTAEVAAGDVVILPAGTGHRNAGSSPDFGVVGAYPDGMHWDLCRGDPSERLHAKEKIAQVPRPECDPVFGENGPLFEYWE